MSLLRNVLKQSQPTGHPDVSADSPLPVTSKRSVKRYAASIKSSGGASMRSLADSMLSFYSVMTGGGKRVPKRRRADISKLGKAQECPNASPVHMFTRGTGSVLHPRKEGEKPWLGLVLYSHAHPEATMPLYHNAAKVTGEVRMVLDTLANLGSIDVWVVITSDSSTDAFKPPIAAMTVNVWNRKKGDPRYSTPDGGPFAGKFPAGTFVFPFELPALPEDALVKHPDDTNRKNLARVPLPPTYYVSKVSSFWGIIKYMAGVNVVRKGLGAIDDEFDMEFQYLPLCKPLPRVKTPFPYLPAREDWPFRRETLGGWTLTPFGGRGRLGDELVEVEGILGIQEPAIYTAGQMLEFSLLLWSSDPHALEALGQPGAVEVGLCKADVFSTNALDPRMASRQDRYTAKLAAGRVWRTDDGRLADDAPVAVVQMVKLADASTPTARQKTSPLSGGLHESHHVKGVLPSRMREIHAGNDEDDDATLADRSDAALKLGGESQDDGNTYRASSPTLSLEDLDAEDPHETDHFVRLDGELRVPACSHPSFRYTHMGLFPERAHPAPTIRHISPSATGLLAECPVWYVLDRFAHLPPAAVHSAAGAAQDFAALPVSGVVIPVGPDAVRAPTFKARIALGSWFHTPLMPSPKEAVAIMEKKLKPKDKGKGKQKEVVDVSDDSGYE
ncbi:hypothetical protein B0H13DRAFT_2341110 [Mycena leptocephala]|nr:hypothetical protein B0H13DRAFT_2341110 [Mycena leptocephala]